MGGLQRLFLRITPIIMLICFVCLGISHTFQQEGQPNITYLTAENITIDVNNTETTEDDITITNYSFDFQAYRQNINQNILKRSTQNLFNIDAYNQTFISFKNLWEDGYDIGDVFKTIINVGILIVNSIIFPINIFLLPLRITCGILLTAFSIIGINITYTTAEQKPLISFIHNVIDNAAIPLLTPTWDKTIDQTQTQNVQFIFNEILAYPPTMNNNEYRIISTTIDFQETDETGRYQRMDWYYQGPSNFITKLVYVDTQGYEIEVYNYQDGWIYNSSKNITTLSDSSVELGQLLAFNATRA